MRLIQRATDSSYREAIQHEENQGRFPIAFLTCGYVSGLGWGFLRPWEQLQLFPEKGTLGGVEHADRHHQRFWILRVWPIRTSAKHPRHSWEIEGRYWEGLVWRHSWGKRFGIWRARRAFLDPDIVTHDPQRADDWGSKPGEEW